MLRGPFLEVFTFPIIHIVQGLLSLCSLSALDLSIEIVLKVFEGIFWVISNHVIIAFISSIPHIFCAKLIYFHDSFLIYFAFQ